jgi:hypothetical protein
MGGVSSLPETMKQNQLNAMEEQRRIMMSQMVAVTRERTNWYYCFSFACMILSLVESTRLILNLFC